MATPPASATAELRLPAPVPIRCEWCHSANVSGFTGSGKARCSDCGATTEVRHA